MSEKKKGRAKALHSGRLLRKQRQREIERLNRLYAALSELSRSTVRVKSRDELFQEVCRISTETAGFKLGWVGWHEPDTKAVIPVARAGNHEGYVGKVKVYSDDRPEGRGATGTCIREGRICIFNDFLHDPLAVPWHEVAAEHGLRAVAGLPILSQGTVWGALTIYDSEANVFQDKEVALLEEATAAISFGLENLERETQRQRAEEALKASEERYRVLVETIPQLAWRTSHGGLEVDCNRRWYEYTGQTPAQVRYHGWLAAVHPDDLVRVAERILHATNQGEPYELEYRLRRASDNSYRWHLSRAIPMRNQDGQITDWFGCATDIEDLKQAQQVLKQAHDEQLERHRTELAHVARLSMMGEMVASLAHELNQPLQAVNNYASGSLLRLQKTPQGDEQLVAVLEEIRKEASRAAEIARRVRRFAKKRESQFSAVSLNHLVEEVVLFSKIELEHRHAKVALELGGESAVRYGRPGSDRADHYESCSQWFGSDGGNAGGRSMPGCQDQAGWRSNDPAGSLRSRNGSLQPGPGEDF